VLPLLLVRALPFRPDGLQLKHMAEADGPKGWCVRTGKLSYNQGESNSWQSHEEWLKDVQTALRSINLPFDDWHNRWQFNFEQEFRAGVKADDAAMKANRFWWHETEQVAPTGVPQDARLLHYREDGERNSILEILEPVILSLPLAAKVRQGSYHLWTQLASVRRSSQTDGSGSQL
jgi:hypothetical protein